MNLLYILGNGFDINLGLKTGYQDFYDYYKEDKNEDPDIIAMKESIEKERYSTWSDLEEGLGKYTSQISRPDVFTKCLTDIKQSLIQFLNNQYEARCYELNSKKISEDLLTPEAYLNEQTANEYAFFLQSIGSIIPDNTHVKVVTFNYTRTIEDLLSNRFGLVSRILHIHGQLADSIVMGVSDMEQVSNDAFHGDRDISEEFIKPDYNDACLNARNSIFESMIDSADVIVLFGTSLGKTDRKWWRLIGERLIDKAYRVAVLYFPFDSKKDTRRHPNYRLRWTEGYQKDLLKAFEIPDEQSQEVLSRVFIGINTDIFKLPIRSQPTSVGLASKIQP